MSPEEMMEKEVARDMIERDRKERLELDARDRADESRRMAIKIGLAIGFAFMSLVASIFVATERANVRDHEAKMKALEVELEKAKLDNQHPPLWRHK